MPIPGKYAIFIILMSYIGYVENRICALFVYRYVRIKSMGRFRFIN